MAKEPVISYGGRKRSISVFVGLVLTGVILTCIVFPKIVFTGQSIVPLQMTIEANLSENPALSELQTQHDTSQEEQLIESLMQDVVISAKAEPKEGWQYVQMRVTGYCTCSQCCGSFSDGITANNHHIQPGDAFVAADKSYRFGTEMVIPGYNASQSVQVKDRGGAIKGNRLDLFFHTHQQALQWGVQYLDVLIKTN
jgi:3D (Asp-Asp-Asp) domain-containing protein